MPTTPPTKASGKKSNRSSTTSDFVAKVIVFLSLASAAVVVNLVTYNDAVTIKDDLWLNSHGILARNGTLYIHHGRRTEDSLCAYYDTQQGKAYSKCIELWFPFDFINENSPEIIHYDPASPKHISTSWGRQVLVSRTFMLLLVFAFAFLIDFGIVMWVIEKLSGLRIFTTATRDDRPVSSQPASSRSTAEKSGPGLLSAARELSKTFDLIVAGLETQSGSKAAYANAVAAELILFIAQYNRAVESHSRDEASRALDEVIACMNDFKADKKKRGMHFGFRHWRTMLRYESLKDLFRETKYRNDSL